MFSDFDQIGRLMQLAQQVDVEAILRLSKKIDLGSLLATVSVMGDAELAALARLVEAHAAGGTSAVHVDGPDPIEASPGGDDTMEAPRKERTATDGSATAVHRPFRTAAVLGAGTMGAQIAAHLANAGIEVLLLDMAAEEGDRNALVQRGFDRLKGMKPAPFFTDEDAAHVTLGNFEDDFGRIAGIDWVVEAVVERLDVKRSLLARIEQTVGDDTVVSTNTSGLPIADIAEGRSEGFRRRFLGTHFYNPPRYLRLLELVPSADTDAAVVERVASFARVHLGKGIVVAKDTPYFIGNRIGVYGMLQAIRQFTDGDFSIEDIDAVTGELVGRPKSATFRTADVVGLDVMRDVAANLYEAVPEDESRDAFEVPELLDALVERGTLGQKTGAGFYKKEGKVIKSIDPDTGEYTEPEALDIGDLDRIRRMGSLRKRIVALYDDKSEAGDLFRWLTLDLLGYAARRIPEIAESPADVDRAIRWGFGWQLGPFELWDVLGMERVRLGLDAYDVDVADWVEDMRFASHRSFYRGAPGRLEVFIPAREEYVVDAQPEDTIDLPYVRSKARRVLWENDEAELLDVGDGVALFAFRSKANTLGREVMVGLAEAIDRIEGDPRLLGLVVGNDGKNFSVGANLGEVAAALASGQLDALETALKAFQDTVQRVRYAAKPVVVAVHQRVLGGACELLMACPHPVASAESYVGLVELGVGLIPAGTGTMRLAAMAARQAPNGHPSEIQAWLQRYFENVAMARVATSAREAQAMGYLPASARVVMNDDRRLFVAKQEVIRLSTEGYRPPRPEKIKVLGAPTRAAIEVMLQQYLEGGYISAYDFHLGKELAFVMTGGPLTAPQMVDEGYLLALEREVILRLLHEEKTQQRIESIIETNKPLRN